MRPLSRAPIWPLALFSVVACGGGSSTTGVGGGGGTRTPSIASVTVTPATDTALSLDQEVTFHARARDAAGRTVTNQSFTWTSTAAAVASVSDQGVATSHADGSTRIVASAGGHADTALLVVSQTTATVVVTPDSASLTGAGDTVRFAAEPRDAQGNPVGGDAIGWAVSDTAVAAVDSTGLVTARTTGVATVSATAASGVIGSAGLRVFAGGAPQVASVSPSPLKEGEAATITGQGFGPDTASNTVQIDGISAIVTSASTTSLEIMVPTYDCLPARSVTVAVTTPDGSGQAGFALDPDEPSVSTAVGSESIVADPSDLCLQFPAAADTQSYLIGVQSVSTTDGLTPVVVTSTTAAGPAPAPSLALGARFAAAAGGGSVAPRLPEWRRTQLRADLRIREWERQHLDPAASIPALRASAGPRPSFSVSGGVAVGDTVALRVPNGDGGNLCTSYTDIRAVVKVIGARAILTEDVGNPSGGMSQSDYQTLSDRLDNEILSTLSDYFGQPTDIDGNGHIVAVFTKEVNRTWPGVAAFVFSGDLYPRDPGGGAYCSSSDEGEIYYSRAPDPTGAVNPNAPVTATDLRRRAPLVMAHELTHVIQQGHRFQAGDSYMASWLAEGQAFLAQEVVGHAVLGNATGQDYDFSVAQEQDAQDGTAWYIEELTGLGYYYGYKSSTERVAGAPAQCGWLVSDPSPCQGIPLWYSVGWSFLRWVSDRYGPAYPGGEKGLQRALIESGATGMGNVQSVVGVPWPTLLARWAAALYVDGRVSGLDPDLSFSSWNLQDITVNHFVPTAQLQPDGESFTDWTLSASVHTASSEYIRLAGGARPATAVRVRGLGESMLPSSMQVWVVRLR
jgi:hypothetical protein